MASQQVICASRVYELKKQTIGKDKWIESWLSLDNEGNLIWSKDRETTTLGKASLKHCFKDIKFEPLASTEPHSPTSTSAPTYTAYVMAIPIQIISHKNVNDVNLAKEETKKFAVKGDSQLQGWLDSFAKALSKFDQMKAIQERLYNSQAIVEKKDGRFIIYSAEWTPVFWNEFLKANYKQ